MSFSSVVITSLFGIVLTALIAPLSCHAQTPNRKAAILPSLPATEIASKGTLPTLAQIMAAYAERTGTVLIADVPAVMAKNELPYRKTLDSPPETIEALQAQVLPLDYDVEDKGKIIILRKRYDVPGDVPDVSPDECRHFLDDALKLIEPFKVEEPPSIKPGTMPLVTNLYTLLSNEQKKANPPARTAIRDLPAAQRTALRQSSLFIYTADSVAIWTQARAVLSATPTTMFIESSSRPRGASQGVFGFVSVPGEREKFSPLRGVGNVRKMLFVEPIKGLVSLDAVVERISATQKKPVKLSDGLSGKQLLLFGSVEKEPQKTLEAVGALFGIEVSIAQPGDITLRRSFIEPVSKIEDLASAIYKRCPPALLRAIGKKPVRTAISPIQKLDPQARKQQEEQIYQTAVRASNYKLSRLQDAISSELKATFDRYKIQGAVKKNTVVLYKQLPRQDQAAFAQYVLLPTLRIVRDRFSGNGPDYVRKFDDLYFVGREYETKDAKWYKIMLFTTDATGQSVNALTLDGRVN